MKSEFVWAPGMDVLLRQLRVSVHFVPAGDPKSREALKLYPLEDYRRGMARSRHNQELNRMEVESHLNGDSLIGRCFAQCDSGSSLINLDVVAENGITENAPGDLQGDFYIKIDGVPGARVYPRYALPHGLSPVGDYSTWKLPLSHLPAGKMRPASFVVLSPGANYWDAVYALEHPNWIKRKGDFIIPQPKLDNRTVRRIMNETREDWEIFQRSHECRLDAFAEFGMPRVTGSSGEQWRLGHNPMPGVSNSQVQIAEAPDRMRGILMLVEGNRPHWFQGIPIWNSNHSRSAYFFEGIHWSSRWKAGYGMRSGINYGFMGDQEGWTGYNLEHCVSMLPALAYYTQDPLLMHMTRRLGVVTLNSLCSHDIASGGYYGGGFTKARAALRPMRTLLECAQVSNDGFLGGLMMDRYCLWVEKLLALDPFMGHAPTEAREQVRGLEPVVDNWQLGLGAHAMTASLLQPGEVSGESSRKLVRDLQELHMRGWRGEDPNLMEMAKFTLASDPTIGRGWTRNGHNIELWNLALMMVPNLDGVNQLRRLQILDAMLSINPGVQQTKWGCRVDWKDFTPLG